MCSAWALGTVSPHDVGTCAQRVYRPVHEHAGLGCGAEFGKILRGCQHGPCQVSPRRQRTIEREFVWAIYRGAHRTTEPRSDPLWIWLYAGAVRLQLWHDGRASEKPNSPRAHRRPKPATSSPNHRHAVVSGAAWPAYGGTAFTSGGPRDLVWFHGQHNAPRPAAAAACCSAVDATRAALDTPKQPAAPAPDSTCPQPRREADARRPCPHRLREWRSDNGCIVARPVSATEQRAPKSWRRRVLGASR
jgi:hypothetical protein